MLDGMTSPTTKDLFYRTRPCKFYLKGKCNRGQNCTFVHPKKEPPTELYRTRMCTTFMQEGYCENGYECPFAHDTSEIRPKPTVKSDPLEHSSEPKKEYSALEEFLFSNFSAGEYSAVDLEKITATQKTPQHKLKGLQALDLTGSRTPNKQCSSTKTDMMSMSHILGSAIAKHRQGSALQRHLQTFPQDDCQQILRREPCEANQYLGQNKQALTQDMQPSESQKLQGCSDTVDESDQIDDENMDMMRLFDRLHELSSSQRASTKPGNVSIAGMQRPPIQNTDLQSRQLDRHDVERQAFQNHVPLPGKRQPLCNENTGPVWNVRKSESHTQAVFPKAAAPLANDNETTEALQQLVKLLSDTNNTELLQQALQLPPASRPLRNDGRYDHCPTAGSPFKESCKNAPPLDARYLGSSLPQHGSRLHNQRDQMPLMMPGDVPRRANLPMQATPNVGILAQALQQDIRRRDHAHVEASLTNPMQRMDTEAMAFQSRINSAIIDNLLQSQLLELMPNGSHKQCLFGKVEDSPSVATSHSQSADVPVFTAMYKGTGKQCNGASIRKDASRAVRVEAGDVLRAWAEGSEKSPNAKAVERIARDKDDEESQELGTSTKDSLLQTKGGLQNQFGVVVKNTFIEVEEDNFFEAFRVKSYTAPDLPLISEDTDEVPHDSASPEDSPASTPRAETGPEDSNASSKDSSITRSQLDESLDDFQCTEDTPTKHTNSTQAVRILPFSSGGSNAATVILRHRF